jgi:hemoglobin/transferrin/lactoferrin receptor protein
MSPAKLTGKFPTQLFFLCGLFIAAAVHASSGAPDADSKEDRKPTQIAVAETAVAAGEEASAQREGRKIEVANVKSNAIEEITVTATRTERPTFTTPSAVSVIDGSDFAPFQPLSYSDVFEGTPGVAIQGGARRIAEEPSIRGFSDQQLVLRVDGARQNFDLAHRGRFFVDPDLIRRIEVVRGSASALYGSGAIGGVISLETMGAEDLLEAGESFGGRAKFGYQGNGNEIFASGGVFGAVGMVDAFANFVYREIFDDLEDGRGEAIADTRDRLLNGLVKLGITPAEHHRFEIVVDTFDSSGDNPTAADAVSTPTTVVGRDTREYNLRSNYTFRDPANPWVDFGLSAYYQKIDVSEDRFVDARLDESDFESYGVELHNTTRFAPTGRANFALTYGFEFFEDRQSGTRNGADRIEFPDAKRSFFAGYAQAEIDLFDGRVSLVPGVRVDRFEIRPEGDFSRRDETNASPRVSIGVNPTDWLYLWSSYAEAFRAPTLTELFNDGVHFAIPNGLGPGTFVINEFRPTPLLEPEDAQTVEAGVRIRQSGLLLTGDSLEVNGNYFSSDIDNFVDTVVAFLDFTKPPVFTPPAGPVTFFGSTTNTNTRARIAGFEGEIRYDSPYLFVAVSGFTVYGDNRETGQGLGSIPQDSVTLRLTGKLPRYALQFGARSTIASAQTDVPEASVTTGAFETVDLFASWSPVSGPIKGSVVTLGVDNLFDEIYSVHPTVILQPGRSVRLTLAHRFGL